MVINSILMFCHRLKTQLAGRRPYAKLFAFKIIVLFTFLQSVSTTISLTYQSHVEYVISFLPPSPSMFPHR